MYIPLAERLRPTTLDEIVGQEHLLGPHSLIRGAVRSKRPLSLLLWGPAGSGKTSLARAYAHDLSATLIALSAVSTAVADIRRIIEEISSKPLLHTNTILFIDEIHRYNKAQQDLFLPYLEKGLFTLVGATTENPSFALNSALLSRLHLLALRPLSRDGLEQLLVRYEQRMKAIFTSSDRVSGKQEGPDGASGGKGIAPAIAKEPDAPSGSLTADRKLTEEVNMARVNSLPLEAAARALLIELAQGDGRSLLNMVEQLQMMPLEGPLSAQQLQDIVARRAALFDRAGEQHYNLISALHKAVRGSDPQASLYWFARLVEGGEQMLFVARRLIRMASEDIGLADPQALALAVAARDAYEMLGSPEGELALAQVVVYLALAPKSNSLYKAYGSACSTAAQTTHLPPPFIILNAPTELMRQQGYGVGYQYDHDVPHAFSGQNYFPDGLEPREYYIPAQRGFEREMSKRLTYFAALREKIRRDREEFPSG